MTTRACGAQKTPELEPDFAGGLVCPSHCGGQSGTGEGGGGGCLTDKHSDGWLVQRARSTCTWTSLYDPTSMILMRSSDILPRPGPLQVQSVNVTFVRRHG